MQAQIESLDLVVRGNAHADQRIGDSQNHERADARQHPGNQDASGLIEDLCRVAVDEAERQRIAGCVF